MTTGAEENGEFCIAVCSVTPIADILTCSWLNALAFNWVGHLADLRSYASLIGFSSHWLKALHRGWAPMQWTLLSTWSLLLVFSLLLSLLNLSSCWLGSVCWWSYDTLQLWQVAEVRRRSSVARDSQRSHKLLGVGWRNQTSYGRGEASSACKVLFFVVNWCQILTSVTDYFIASQWIIQRRC